MCYAIPGLILSIEGDRATLGYFGEKRLARIISGSYAPGDYVYAQGGVVLDKVPEDIAKEALADWAERFRELKRADEALASSGKTGGGLEAIIARAFEGKDLSRSEMLRVLDAGMPDAQALYEGANRIRHERHGNACCVHGILEFSNHCMNDCHYCGIRCSNRDVGRYRMGQEEVLAAVDEAVTRHNFRALVLQSGEDAHQSDATLLDLVRRIRERHNILLFLSVGERSEGFYTETYEAGAYGALMRFETSNRSIYSRMRPGRELDDRLRLIKHIKDTGFVLATGFLIGLPGASRNDLVNDILLTKSLKPDMYSFGPLIPHPGTPLADVSKPSLDDVLKATALCRLADPDSNLLVTSATETLSYDARRSGLLAGANSLMINTTPHRYRTKYNLYPGKSEGSGSVEADVQDALALLHGLGRAPTDLGVAYGIHR